MAELVLSFWAGGMYYSDSNLPLKTRTSKASCNTNINHLVLLCTAVLEMILVVELATIPFSYTKFRICRTCPQLVWERLFHFWTRGWCERKGR
jgi:hypothetical protein